MADLEATFGAPLIEAYGMTEAAHQMASNPLAPRPRKPGTVGVAAGPEVAIMDEAGSLLPVDKRGEIVIRGPNVMVGYENNPAANATAFTNGWFRTGDEGYLDSDGYLTITGRLKEIINRGGEKIAPREIDEVLLEHPAVAQAVAFAIPDARLGEDIAAAVVLQNGESLSEKELRHFTATNLADFKVPKRVVFLDEIPTGATGKVQRLSLAEQLDLKDDQRGSQHVELVEPRTAVEVKLAELWKEVLKIDRVGANDRFLDLGGDSMLATRLVYRIREEMRLELPLLAAFDAPTVAAQAALVEQILSAPDAGPEDRHGRAL
jgi:acyl-CoA synthetase (AMP-forming)/AMP-acid ligase II/acyl carrier protein